jgi:hypothetical protein
MTNRTEDSEQQPPTDAERVRVLARLIDERIRLLSTMQRGGRSTPVDNRELFVLEQLRDGWLLEGQN